MKRGVVALNGHVDSWGKRIAAQEAAHRVAGVLDVANDLVVHLPGSKIIDDEVDTYGKLIRETGIKAD